MAPATNQRRLLTLYLCYGPPSEELEELRRMLAPLPWEQAVLIIRNDLTDLAERELDLETSEVGGDNRAFEFSGWQKGLESAKVEQFSPDLIILANDAFTAAGLSSIPVFDAATLDCVHEQRGVAGRVRALPCPFRRGDREVWEYLQTHLIILHPAILQELGSVVAEWNADDLIKPEFDQDWSTAHPIWTRPFRHFVFHLLTDRWHARGKRFNARNYPFFRRKVLSIVNEMSLSQNFAEFAILDLTPLPGLLDSPLVVYLAGNSIAPFQAMRNLIFGVFDLIFFNAMARKAGLDHWFRASCARRVNLGLSARMHR